MSDTPSSKVPLFVSLALVVGGIALGLSGSSILGGLLAAGGAIPGCYAAWTGMQQEGQGGLIGAIGMILVSLGVGAVLIVLGIIGKLH